MWSLIKNEIMKLKYKKKTFIIPLLLIAILVGVNVTSYNSDSIMSNVGTSFLDLGMKQTEQQIDGLKNKQVTTEKEKADNELQIKKLEQGLEEMKKQKNEIVNSTAEERKEKLVKDELATNQGKVKQLEPIKNLNNKEKLDLDKSKVVVNNNQYLIDNNQINKSMSGKIFFDNSVLVYSMVLILFLIILNADLMAEEYNPATIKFLGIQPISKHKILLSKMIVGFIFSSIVFIGSQLLGILITSLIYGGGFNGLQQAVYTTSSTIIPFSTYVGYYFLCELLVIFAYVNIVLMFSVICRSTFVAFMCSLLFGAVIDMAKLMSPALKDNPYLSITSYTGITNMLNGSFLEKQDIGLPIIILVISIWTIVSMVTTHIIFRKRNLV